jgi:hypothetical protein
MGFLERAWEQPYLSPDSVDKISTNAVERIQLQNDKMEDILHNLLFEI